MHIFLTFLVIHNFWLKVTLATGILKSNNSRDFTADWISTYTEDGTETPISWERHSIQNYQERMPVVENENSDRVDCPHNLPDLVEWDDPVLQWPNRSTEGPPAADGITITLPDATSMIIRSGVLIGTSSSPYGQIIIPTGSRLIFDDTTDTILLHTLGIRVEGALEAGSPTCRLEGKIQITLHGTYENPSSGSDRHLSTPKPSMDVKGIVVPDISGARWDFHGKLYHPTWTRLAALVPGSVDQGTPLVRNKVLFLQECVNWPEGGRVVVTTSHVKDTRSYNYNEEGVIEAAGVECVSIHGETYGKITLVEPLLHYHHAGEREYQCEVFLLSRNIVVQGNEYSDPTDSTPLGCPANHAGFTDMPCPNTFLTGFGGHTIIIGQSEGRLRGIEFYRMGMTNVVGRYPVHFHYSTTGDVSALTDCSVHRSYYRAYTIHNTFHLNILRNTAYDISGHAYYLESGVEEFNRVEYNLAAFVHVINGAVIMLATEKGSTETADCAIPADHTASGFYISNVHNYILHNAASGGWAGIQFPILPQPADPNLRFNGVVPKNRPALDIRGNSVHSSGWFAVNSGAVYSGGSLYWEEDDSESKLMKYNAGRISSIRLTRDTRDEEGEMKWFQVHNSTVWLVNVGATGWGKRSEYRGFEVHDFQRRGIFVLFSVWLDTIVLNCRTSNAPRVPDPGTGNYENKLNDGRHFSGFFTYDHLMQHILTDWKISNCGGASRNLKPWVSDGQADTEENGLFTIPVNGFGPEVQLISSGFQYDWETVGGKNFTNESIFFGRSGQEDVYSMQYMSNWEDADGSMTQSPGRTVIGPARAGRWWHLDYRPGQCETRTEWKFPQMLCQKQNRHLASMFTVVMPQSRNSYSAVFEKIYTNGENFRKIRQGSMTHFGFKGDKSILTCSPPETCKETTSRSWDADLTGPYNHAKYGGWYLSFDLGTPAELTVQRIQMEEGTIMLQAMNLPPSTVASDIHLWAESYGRKYNFALTNSLDEVRSSEKGDLYWFDLQTNTLYWRVITGYVDRDSTFDWINRKENGKESFTRGNLSIPDITTKNQYQLHIEISCETDEDTANAFCLEKPEFVVPGMGCPEGEVMLSIDECGLPCELDDSCEQESPEPSISQSLKPSMSQSLEPSMSQSLEPSISQSLEPSMSPSDKHSSVPSSSTTTSCSENANAKFYYKKVKKKHLNKTCKWLGKKNKKVIKKICNKYIDYYKNIGPAQTVCKETCSSCDICYENQNSKFTMKLKSNGKAVYKTCKWLASQSNTAKICTKTDSKGGYGPPGSVCPQTCSTGSCTATRHHFTQRKKRTTFK